MSEPTETPPRRPRPGARQVSMADVAERAGVSAITVSRALHHPDRVSERTRAAIDAAIAELGYVPNLLAGGLASTNTRIVSMIVPYVTHGVFADAIQGASDAFDDTGFSVLLGNSGGSPQREETIVRNLLGHRPAGVLVQGANHTEATRRILQNAAVPVVEMGTLPARPIDMAVGYSNHEAARTMTRFLALRGRRRIAFVSVPPAENDRANERLRGFKLALEEMDLAFFPELVFHTRYGIPEGREALAYLLDRPEPPDAVFCASDLWAYGMVSECARRGIKVPDDIAITGFNDQELASETEPGITTIRVPRYEIGRVGGELIMKRIEGLAADKVVDLGFKLIERGSA
ncbi:LacI family DNA-binding transcriptional regulator [Acuticoccus sp. M5D2P5]|uniref:LacI family DNA-binding transcriptional regulator n=1 Tax=Acuticoccus kalidii TaxID=2910977 RepID=UPI001F46E04A|nr:LacI family DNA-binding transcriptional regulator [Acuticoccus kalidii]MCF3936729.1 LacI family DNA-binding transcriptional regulator [Acuticoccus kalidii]